MQQHTQASEELLIRISAHRHNGHVASVSVDIPANVSRSALVIGLEPAAAVHTLRQHATHSPRSHAQALAQACAAAAGHPEPDRDSQFATERDLAAEAADTHLQRLLIDWPQCLGMDPLHSRYAELHRRLTTKTDPASYFELGGDILDLVASEMLAGFYNRIHLPYSLAEFIDRADRGGIMGAVLREMINLGPSKPQRGHTVPTLGILSAAAWASVVGGWPTPEFITQPTFGGETAEAGPLARHAASPLVRLLLERGHRLSARLFAKVIDLADCASRLRHPFTDDVPPMIDATQVSPGIGLARVSTARGVLLCWVRLAEGVIADCAIIPAGYWNFHPDGPFCREACANIAETHDAALLRLNLLAMALDPSLPYVIELTEDTSKTSKTR